MDVSNRVFLSGSAIPALSGAAHSGETLSSQTGKSVMVQNEGQVPRLDFFLERGLIDIRARAYKDFCIELPCASNQAANDAIQIYQGELERLELTAVDLLKKNNEAMLQHFVDHSLPNIFQRELDTLIEGLGKDFFGFRFAPTTQLRDWKKEIATLTEKGKRNVVQFEKKLQKLCALFSAYQNDQKKRVVAQLTEAMQNDTLLDGFRKIVVELTAERYRGLHGKRCL